MKNVNLNEIKPLNATDLEKIYGGDKYGIWIEDEYIEVEC